MHAVRRRLLLGGHRVERLQVDGQQDPPALDLGDGLHRHLVLEVARPGPLTPLEDQVVRVGLGDALTLPGVLAATAAAVAVAAATTVVIWRVGG